MKLRDRTGIIEFELDNWCEVDLLAGFTAREIAYLLWVIWAWKIGILRS